MNRPSVLVVDDDLTLQRIAALAMGHGGWRVRCVSNGEHALHAAQEDPPDVILLDAMMPGWSGVATLEALRADPLTARVPVIFLTVRVAELDVARYRAVGAVGVIAKPFDPMALPAEVLRLLRAAA